MACQPGDPDPLGSELPSRAEMLAALSVATDLGVGQPSEHTLRAALIGTKIADRLGLTRDQRDCTYYTNLVMWIGCHADSTNTPDGSAMTSRSAAIPRSLTGRPCLMCGSCSATSPAVSR
jgi:hypothetical protein